MKMKLQEIEHHDEGGKACIKCMFLDERAELHDFGLFSRFQFPAGEEKLKSMTRDVEIGGI